MQLSFFCAILVYFSVFQLSG